MLFTIWLIKRKKIQLTNLKFHFLGGKFELVKFWLDGWQKIIFSGGNKLPYSRENGAKKRKYTENIYERGQADRKAIVTKKNKNKKKQDPPHPRYTEEHLWMQKSTLSVTIVTKKKKRKKETEAKVLRGLQKLNNGRQWESQEFWRVVWVAAIFRWCVKNMLVV